MYSTCVHVRWVIRKIVLRLFLADQGLQHFPTIPETTHAITDNFAKKFFYVFESFLVLCLRFAR